MLIIGEEEEEDDDGGLLSNVNSHGDHGTPVWPAMLVASTVMVFELIAVITPWK